MMKKLKRYLMLYHVFFKNSLAGSMEHRANFLMAILVECAFLLIKLLYVIVSYQMDLRVNGLTPDSILLFVGTYTFITGIMSLIYFPNFLKIPYYVQDGTLDIYLTKPVSLQFMISFRYIDFGWAIPNIFGGIAMIAIAFVKLDLQLRIGQILGFILYNFLGIVLTYSLLFLPELLAFWFTKTQWIRQIVYALWDFNNMPMHIYGRPLRNIGVYIIPFFVITNFPPLMILGKLNILDIAWGIFIPNFLLIVTRVVWKIAVRKYESASS